MPEQNMPQQDLPDNNVNSPEAPTQGADGYWGNPPAISSTTGTGSVAPITQPAPAQPVQQPMPQGYQQPAQQMPPSYQQPVQQPAPQPTYEAGAAQPPSPYDEPETWQPKSQDTSAYEQAKHQPPSPYYEPVGNAQSGPQGMPYQPNSWPQAYPPAGSQPYQAPYTAQPGQQFVNGQPYGQPYAQQPYGQPYPQPQKKSSAPMIIIGIVVAFLLLMGGCVACGVVLTLADMGRPADNYEEWIEDFDENYLDDYTRTELGNMQARLYFNLADLEDSSLPSGDAISESEMDTIKEQLEKDAANASVPDGGNKAGFYKVGEDIPAGTYWIDGNDTAESYFFIFEKADDGYNTAVMNHYYGKYMAEFKDGQYLAVDNGSYFMPIDSAPKAGAPYLNGVYRVGTDIPAGTYTLKGGKADDYCAYFIMDSLDFAGDSNVIEQSEFYGADMIPSEYTITLEEGTYLELYNMEAVSNIV